MFEDLRVITSAFLKACSNAIKNKKLSLIHLIIWQKGDSSHNNSVASQKMYTFFIFLNRNDYFHVSLGNKIYKLFSPVENLA